MKRAHNSLSMHCQKQCSNDVGQYVDMSTGACGLANSELGGHRILLDNIDFETVLILIETLCSTCIWLFLSEKVNSSFGMIHPSFGMTPTFFTLLHH